MRASSSRIFFLLFLSVSVSNVRFEVNAEEALTEDNGELGFAKQFNPSRNDEYDNQEVHMYYGSFGGASNCENCLVKARWLAEKLRVDTLHVPACKRKPGDEEQFPTMNPMEYFDERSLRSCNSKSAVLAMDGGDGDAYDSSLASPAYSFNVESLGRRITADAVNGMPCFELVEGWCEIEKHRLGEYLIPKHKTPVPGKEIYFAGMYDFEPVDPKTGKKYPNVWQKEAQRYVKGETEKLGWADEAVEKRRRERDAARAKKAAEAKEKNFNKDRHDKNNDISTFGLLPTGETLGRAVNQQNIPRRDMFLAREQQIRQQQLQAEHQLSEETFREAWNENANSNANRRRARNLLAFSSIEPCYSNGNLNDEIYEEANKEIEKLKIEPSDTLCVHWRQEDFLWKRIGNDFVKNVSYAAERIIHRAEASKLKTVLLLTNDPEMYPDDKRYDGRVAVNTLRGMLHEIGGLRVEWSMHRNEPDKSKAIYIDKATCSMMVDFIGTGKSSFTATIMDMRQTHELCLIDDPKDARLGRKSNRSINSKEGNALTTTGEKSAASPGFKYKMCLKEQYGGVSRNHRSPFIFPSDEFEHPIQAVETLLDSHTKTPSTNDDDDSDDDDGDEIDLRGGPEVVDEYLAEKEIKTFKSKEKKIEPEVEKINHDEYVREYQEENQQSNAMKEFSVLDPSISSEDLKLDLRELDDDASVECDRCYAAMPQSEVATPNAEIWLTTPSCEKCGVQLLRVQKQRANQGSEKKKKK
ncbi:unnamed protein product [Bathycoccus prasinos]